MGENPRLQAEPSEGLRYVVVGEDAARSYTVYRCHYHLVFITKYRKLVLRGEIGLRVRELTREICRTHDIEFVKIHVRPDHVHLLLSVPPTMALSRVMQAIKGKAARTLRRTFWGKLFLARGGFRLNER